MICKKLLQGRCNMISYFISLCKYILFPNIFQFIYTSFHFLHFYAPNTISYFICIFFQCLLFVCTYFFFSMFFNSFTHLNQILFFFFFLIFFNSFTHLFIFSFFIFLILFLSLYAFFQCLLLL